MRSYQSECCVLYCIFSLLAPWGEGQFTGILRRCPQRSLRIASSVPHCGVFEGIGCDPFLFSAAELAGCHLNDNSSLLDDVTVEVFRMDADVSI